jgi:hypothetical protein
MGAYLRLGLWCRDPSHFDTPKTKELWRHINPPAWKHYPGFEIPTPPPLPGTPELPPARAAA